MTYKFSMVPTATQIFWMRYTGAMIHFTLCLSGGLVQTSITEKHSKYNTVPYQWQDIFQICGYSSIQLIIYILEFKSGCRFKVLTQQIIIWCLIFRIIYCCQLQHTTRLRDQGCLWLCQLFRSMVCVAFYSRTSLGFENVMVDLWDQVKAKVRVGFPVSQLWITETVLRNLRQHVGQHGCIAKMSFSTSEIMSKRLQYQ